jgi:lysozyme family protein
LAEKVTIATEEVMADFDIAFQKTMNLEGGFILHKIKGDTGGLTFAGISKNNWPKWSGWDILEEDDNQVTPKLVIHVKDFYRKHFWGAINGDGIESQRITEAIYDLGVNAGVRVAVKLAQTIVNLRTIDGISGPITISALNNANEKFFLAQYVLERVKFYESICSKKSSQRKFFFGWVRRALQFTY